MTRLETKKAVLSIQNTACETLGTLEGMFKRDGFAIENTSAQKEGGIPSRSSDYSAIIVLGGPMAVYDNLTYLQKEQDLIRDAIKNDVPVLGVCLGSQLIAQAAGGRVFKGRKKEIGWHDVSLSPQGKETLFSGIRDGKGEKTIRVFQWHGDTYELPKEATVLAYTDLYPQAFKLGSAIGIQFHLEVDERLIKSWVKEYSAELDAEKIDAKKSILPALGDLQELESKCQAVYRNFTAMVR
ncbi:MAG TPA: type 1 glutamine amidotransferase [Nitrososphaera sp.]|nr:type 1 glutamine amidotransferase [Nitrososphaera sp.]